MPRTRRRTGRGEAARSPRRREARISWLCSIALHCFPLQTAETLIPATPVPSASNPQRPEPPASAPYPANVPAAALRARKARPAQFDSVVEAARSAARAALAPTGDDLEALLIRIHQESARHQAKARRNQERARQEFLKRLEGVPVEQDGRQVVVSMVTTREVIRMLEAESNLIKVEALAQRSYAVHQSIAGPVSRGSHVGIEDFIATLDQSQTSRSAPPRRSS